ncbi:hypothetical protein GF345_04525 [Candidatus Woesearchaeota archaeon]|nr:hypothetical protein [Candidatus Woesearchaeota archaeon]
MQKPIGSEFDLPIGHIFWEKNPQIGRYTPKNKSKKLLSSGRDSIDFLIKYFGLSEQSRVLMPSYLCKEMLKPFHEAGIEPVFYRVKKNLEIDIDHIKKKIKDADAIIIIHYFGFPQKIEELKRTCRKSRTILIEDCAQAFLSMKGNTVLGSEGDASFNSLIKILPLPDGSILTINNESSRRPVAIVGSFRHFLYTKLRYAFLLLKNIYMRMPGIMPEYFFRRSFSTTEKLMDSYPRPARMSRKSMSLLKKLDLDIIKQRRRDNFSFLLKNLKLKSLKPLFKELPEGVCPLGFPVLTKDRDSVKRLLIDNLIYPPVHWHLPEEISKSEFPVSWRISGKILTIPIDQRYSKEDMESIVKVLNQNA